MLTIHHQRSIPRRHNRRPIMSTTTRSTPSRLTSKRCSTPSDVQPTANRRRPNTVPRIRSWKAKEDNETKQLFSRQLLQPCNTTIRLTQHNRHQRPRLHRRLRHLRTTTIPTRQFRRMRLTTQHTSIRFPTFNQCHSNANLRLTISSPHTSLLRRFPRRSH